MYSITLDETGETVKDRKNLLFNKYFSSISEIYSSSEKGEIVRPSSGGLIKTEAPTVIPSSTLTSDFVDDLP